MNGEPAQNFEPLETQVGTVHVRKRPHTLTYEVVSGYDLTPHYGHLPSFSSVKDAFHACSGSDYVVSVEDGGMRPLNPEELAQRTDGD
jgi:hypothetical protein